MTKKEIIESLVGHEFHFTDYGICGLRKNGDIVRFGEVCQVDPDGWDYVKANLYKLPKKWAIAVQHSVLHYEWVDPDDQEYMMEQDNRMLKEEGLI
tara:strand:+ start:818 stop:1105 length:288 start_codon:yes stop_codon:yes gene_type:complete